MFAVPPGTFLIVDERYEPHQAAIRTRTAGNPPFRFFMNALYSISTIKQVGLCRKCTVYTKILIEASMGLLKWLLSVYGRD